MTNRKLLLVDADGDRARATAIALREAGWEPVISRDAMMSFSSALKLRPSVVVLRDQLAGGSVPDAVRRLRCSVYTAAAKIVVAGCSSQRRAGDVLAAGADACIEQGEDGPHQVAQRIEALSGAGRIVTQVPAGVLDVPGRAEAVARYAQVRAGPQSVLEDLTRLAAGLLGTRASMLSLVSPDRQTFLGETGLGMAAGESTPLTHSSCQWVVAGREPVLVTDARDDPVLHTNQAIQALDIVSYLGVPISAGEGHTLGSFCTADSAPRAWEARDLLLMKSLGKMVEAALLAQATKAPATHRTFVVLGHGISAAGSVLRRIGETEPASQDVVLRFLEAQSRELMVQTLAYGAAASASAGQD